MNKKFIILLLLAGGIAIGVWLIPSRDQLPHHGNIQPFTIESAFGGEYEIANNRNKLIVFFFTNCPDICPMTMANVRQLQASLEEERIFDNTFDIVAISLDPEVDRPQEIRKYAEQFKADQEGWYWLRTSTTETKEIADQFSMFYNKSKDGTLSHNTTMYLLDDKNEIRGIYSMATPKQPADIEQMVHDIKKLK